MKRVGIAAVLSAVLVMPPAAAREPGVRILTVRFTPTKRAQIAIWIEKADGAFLQTLRLTDATGRRGIGNRPGASQMNSGYRWPYGRREGVLPVWAHRRAAAPGATAWKRVIFQDRTSEGLASRTSDDASKDDYYCLSFNDKTTRKDGLDAVSCASVFTSDKGRFLTAADLSAGYAEPAEPPGGGSGAMAALPLAALYPPRRDVTRCTTSSCSDHKDVDGFKAEAIRAMPDIDAVSLATPAPNLEQSIMFTVPASWPDGEYAALIELNTEGDYNDTWNDTTYPTPKTPNGSWDFWAMTFGYPFRGQPSIVYRVPFTLGGEGTFQTKDPVGYGSLSGQGADGGDLHAMDSLMTDDPARAPGSGVDRLRLPAGKDYRFQVQMRGGGGGSGGGGGGGGSTDECFGKPPPQAVPGFKVEPYPDEKHSHEWGHMTFTVPSDGQVAGYEVRVGTEPIVDEESFIRATPANGATLETEGLVVPTTGEAGSKVFVDFGGMMPQRQYWVGIRAFDVCNQPGALAVGTLMTSAIHFTKLSGCFIATAAYGTPFARDIEVLRRVRERWLLPNPIGRGAVAIYEDVGPVLADRIGRNDGLRAGVRSLLGPVVGIARAIERLGPR